MVPQCFPILYAREFSIICSILHPKLQWFCCIFYDQNPKPCLDNVSELCMPVFLLRYFVVHALKKVYFRSHEHHNRTESFQGKREQFNSEIFYRCICTSAVDFFSRIVPCVTLYYVQEVSKEGATICQTQPTCGHTGTHARKLKIHRRFLIHIKETIRKVA